MTSTDTENTTDDEGARQVRPFADFLLDLAAGSIHTELSEELVTLVEAVRATGKKGSLQLTLAVATVGANHDALQVTARVTAKPPASDPQSSIFFPDHDGNLRRDNPAQPRLPLSAVDTPPAQVDPTTGEIRKAH